MQPVRSILLMAAVLLSLCQTSHAVTDPWAGAPRRPVTEISQELGVQPSEFRACFVNVSPTPAGQQATAARVRSNKAKLLACLRTANPQITGELLDLVMARSK